MYGRWTFDDKRKMVNDYHRLQGAQCPNDHALLVVTSARFGHLREDGAPSVVHVACPCCMRSFYSDEVEAYPAHGMAQSVSGLAERVVVGVI